MKDKVYLVTVRVDLQSNPFLALVKASTEEAAELKGLALLEYDGLAPLSAQAQEVEVPASPFSVVNRPGHAVKLPSVEYDSLVPFNQKEAQA